MPNRSHERSRVLGGLLCLGTVTGGTLFLYGLAIRSYWAVALPVAALVLFVLGLAFWIGWTIATVQVEPEGEALESAGGPGSATTPDPVSEAPDGGGETPGT
ncbi:MAG: hypothetical protein V3T14_10115 [Myxococcota bacterium]